MPLSYRERSIYLPCLVNAFIIINIHLSNLDQDFILVIRYFKKCFLWHRAVFSLDFLATHILKSSLNDNA